MDPIPRGESATHDAILSNLRHIAAAADLFKLHHARDPITLAELVGPDKYILALIPVEGERYDLLDLRQSQPLLLRRKSGDVIRYER